MHKGHFQSNGKKCEVFDSYEEVCEYAYNPPQFCERCGNELFFYSYFDSLNRYTLTAYCKECKRKFAVSVRQEKYEQRMLHNWAIMVKDRAGSKCEMASDQCNGPLHAHHIIPKALEPARMYDVDNGMCLCEKHHKMIHSYM